MSSILNSYSNINNTEKNKSFVFPTETIISLIFNIVAVAFLWTRNQRSDRWISIFFMNVIFAQILTLIEKFNPKSIAPGLFILSIFIIPLVNIIGGYNYKAQFAFMEQICIYLIFLAYIFITKVGFTKLNGLYDSNNWNFLDNINYYDWAFYTFSLLFSMYLYTTPQNVTMMIGSYLLLFIAFYRANYKFVSTFPLFNNYLSFLLAATIIY
jgi:hypothetical protein